MKFLYALLVVIFLSNTLFVFASQQENRLKVSFFEKGTIQLQIENIQKKEGSIKVAIFNSEDTFLVDDAAYLTNSTQVGSTNSVTITFSEVPYNTYSVAIYHDVNDNNQLDKNLFGVPKEPYGFSNNARSKWGPPKYEAAKFQVNQALVSMRIDVKRWSEQ